MRSSVPLAVTVSLLACSPAALTPSEPGDAWTELSHEVTVRPDGTSVRLEVSRQLRNESGAYQSYEALLELPAGAITTGLRVGTDGRWQPPPRLATAEETSIRWDALTALGDAAPVTLGLLGWSHADEGVELKLSSAAPGETVSVEYTVELPREYAAGALRFDYPSSGARPVFHLADAEGMTVEPVTETAFRLEQRWSPAAPTESRWATWPLGVERHLWRLELDVAAQLGAAPVRPNVVFLVDASHSQGPEGIANQLSLISPFLANAPDAQVEVVLYRRHAERLFGRFVPAPEVPALLGAVPAARLEPANGSNVDEAAALTAELLSGVSGPGRVILFTDGHLRDGLTSEVVNAPLRSLGPDVVVHVVRRARFEYGALQLVRETDDADLAQVASAHGGIAVVADGLAESAPQAAKALLGLLRVVSLDEVTLEGEGFDAEQLGLGATLVEGSSTRVMGVHATPPATLVLKGRLWAREYRQEIALDPRLADRLPGLALGSAELRGELADDEVLSAAFASNAVSPLTSFLSAPAIAAPAVTGIEGPGALFLGLRASGFSSRCGISHCGGRSRRHEPLEPRLKALLADGVAACRAAHGALPVELTLQTTRDEVVAVQANSASPALTACVTEAAWAIRLNAAFNLDTTWNLEL